MGQVLKKKSIVNKHELAYSKYFFIKNEIKLFQIIQFCIIPNIEC